MTAKSGFMSYQEAREVAGRMTDGESGVDHDDDGGGSVSSASRHSHQRSPSASSSVGGFLNRINKVAKKRFSDHGDHHADHIGGGNEASFVKRQSDNVLNTMTMNANQLFGSLYSEHANDQKNQRRSTSSSSSSSSKQRESLSTNLSPQQKALADLALDGGPAPPKIQSHGMEHGSPQQQHGSTNTRQPRHHNSAEYSDFLSSSFRFSKEKQQVGLLSAVMEQSSITSSQGNNASGGRDISSIKGDGGMGGDHGSERSRESHASSSIATRSSLGTRTSAPSLGTSPPQGKCLTKPSEGVSNDGLDNLDGNLIVHENDTISIGRKQIHLLTRDKTRNAKPADFRIQSLLGQGTFAQVFQCLHLQTGNMVAVKVVKNLPAYTRQAAMEIDVLRALTKTSNDIDQSNRSVGSSTANSSPTADNSASDKAGDISSDSQHNSNENGTKWDYMVEMVCYFIYKGHLCLVFELLGNNLYEVLKKRQFRGLPLSVVRTLVHQSVLGTRELAQKSIVHCDLKPENILLVPDDDTDSVVKAGESKPLIKEKKQSADEPFATDASSPKKDDKRTDAIQSSGIDKNISAVDSTNGKSEQSSVEATIDAGPSAEGPHSDASSSKEGSSTSEIPSSSAHSPTRPDQTAPSASSTSNRKTSHFRTEQRIKLIDFGSACFEGQSPYTYIQSRFYRSPEVVIGLPYDSAIDMWSLGCVAAELFLGLPILPGAHEHDQMERIQEMIGDVPDWMLDKGVNATKYYVKFVPPPTPPAPNPSLEGMVNSSPSPRPLPQWRLKTPQEYIGSLSQTEIRKKGGLTKLEKQVKTRYFRRKKLSDILIHKGQAGSAEDKELLRLFIHFLYGTLASFVDLGNVNMSFLSFLIACAFRPSQGCLTLIPGSD